jgi:hypothetical protein
LKLRQFHQTTLITFEITDISLKITSQKLLKKETRDIPFKDILMKDRYELEYHHKSVLPYLSVFTFIAGYLAFFSLINDRMGWTAPSIFAVLSLLCVLRFFISRTKIHIPTKEQGMISLFQKEPGKKSVDPFIHLLEGKVSLSSHKGPRKSDLDEFAEDYFKKNKHR